MNQSNVIIEHRKIDAGIKIGVNCYGFVIETQSFIQRWIDKVFHHSSPLHLFHYLYAIWHSWTQQQQVNKLTWNANWSVNIYTIKYKFFVDKWQPNKIQWKKTWKFHSKKLKINNATQRMMHVAHFFHFLDKNCPYNFHLYSIYSSHNHASPSPIYFSRKPNTPNGWLFSVSFQSIRNGPI